MDPSDLSSLHALLREIARGDLVWETSARAPLWLRSTTVTQLGLVDCGSERVAVFLGPWTGLRVLARDPESWRTARLLPRPRRGASPGAGPAHRLAGLEEPTWLRRGALRRASG